MVCVRCATPGCFAPYQSTASWLLRGAASHHVCGLHHGVCEPPNPRAVYHWRSNIPALASRFRVYAIDCLGEQGFDGLPGHVRGVPLTAPGSRVAGG